MSHSGRSLTPSISNTRPPGIAHHTHTLESIHSSSEISLHQHTHPQAASGWAHLICPEGWKDPFRRAGGIGLSPWAAAGCHRFGDFPLFFDFFSFLSPSVGSRFSHQPSRRPLLSLSGKAQGTLPVSLSCPFSNRTKARREIEVNHSKRYVGSRLSVVNKV